MPAPSTVPSGGPLHPTKADGGRDVAAELGERQGGGVGKPEHIAEARCTTAEACVGLDLTVRNGVSRDGGGAAGGGRRLCDGEGKSIPHVARSRFCLSRGFRRCCQYQKKQKQRSNSSSKRCKSSGITTNRNNAVVASNALLPPHPLRPSLMERRANNTRGNDGHLAGFPPEAVDGGATLPVHPRCLHLRGRTRERGQRGTAPVRELPRGVSKGGIDSGGGGGGHKTLAEDFCTAPQSKVICALAVAAVTLI